MDNGNVKAFSKRHSLKDLTTRKHYRGIHTLSVIINGTVKVRLIFLLNKKTPPFHRWRGGAYCGLP